MIQPPASLSGTSSAPITVVAFNDGQVTIDGQFGTAPVSLDKNAYINLQGFNVKNGTGAVARLSSTRNVTLKRMVMWDADIRLNSAVFYNIDSANTLCEDCAFFGTGAVLIENGFYAGGLTCRRCWGRWEGSTTNWSGKVAFDMGYESVPTSICENCLVTATTLSMPAQFTATDYQGGSTNNPNCVNGSGTQTVVPCPEFIYRVRSGPGNPMYNGRILGSLIYLQSGDTWPGLGMIAIPSGWDASGLHVRHSMSFIHPSNARFNSLLGFILQNFSTAATDLVASNITSVRGSRGDVATAQWSLSNTAFGTSLSANPWTTTGSGANLCNRWLNGERTTAPLWPWPMNQRIIDATNAAGSYRGPCLNCVGGRAVRPATDVTAEIQNLLGTIPTQCRS